MTNTAIVLTYPTVASATNVGTLTQDWALNINQNLTAIDLHDHSASGLQIASTYLNVSSNVDLTGVNILTASTVQFQFIAVTPILSTALFTDGTDLWWSNNTGNQIQITKSGAVNSASAPGPFYGSTAFAMYSNSTETFSFWQTGPPNTYTATLNCGSITASGTTLAQQSAMTLTMPSNFVSTATSTSINYRNTASNAQRRIVTNGATYAFTPVVGDGSLYPTSGNAVPVTDPNGIYHFNINECATFTTNQVNPNMNWNQGPTLSNPNSIEIFCNNAYLTLSGDDLTYQPGEVKTYTITHTFPQLNTIPFYDALFSVNLARWVFIFPSASDAYQTLLIQITNIVRVNTPPTPTYFAVTASITNQGPGQNLLPATTQLSCFLRLAAIFPKFNAGGVFFDAEY